MTTYVIPTRLRAEIDEEIRHDDFVDASNEKGRRHRTVTMYRLGCRCEGCRAAWSAYGKANREKRRSSV